jgi:hypothetical protein
MSKNFFDLLVAITTAVEGLVSGFCVYFAATGKIDTKVANAIADSVIGVCGLALGICSRFIKDDLTKKKKA